MRRCRHERRRQHRHQPMAQRPEPLSERARVCSSCRLRQAPAAGLRTQLHAPTLLARLETDRAPLGFVLIDGDHSTEGVRADINAVLRFKPNRPIFVVFHDSFNPECRSGILTADWHGCPYVHYVEIDFIPGVFHFESFDTAPARSMYGGLALALMLPEKRNFDLQIHESQRGLFETVFKNSCHLKSNENLIVRTKKVLRRTARILKLKK